MKNEKVTTEQLDQCPKEVLISMYVQLQENFAIIQEQNQALMKQMVNLQESIAVMNQNQFGRKTEKTLSLGDQMLFDFENNCIINEAEILVGNKYIVDPEVEQAVLSKPKNKKMKGKREVDLSGIDTTVVSHELSAEELALEFPNGHKRLPDQVYKELVMHPATYEVLEHRIAVYADKKEDRIIRAPKPGRLFINSIATPSLIASVINAKYLNANPYNRISQELARRDLDIPRQNLANWCIKSSDDYFSRIYHAMRGEILRSKLIHSDETPFKVIRDGRGPNANSYMWVYHSGPEYGTPPIYLYDYQPTRKSEHPESFLTGFRGILVTDGFEVYHKLGKANPDTLKIAGCWAHAKRRFAKIVKAVGAKNAKGSIAYEANQRIAAIYHVDHMVGPKNEDASPEDRIKHRKESVQPLVEAFFAWLKENQYKVDPSSETGKAMNYCLNQEKYLKVFLDDPIIPLDNNDAERSIRTFCIGRKNWQVIDSINGARASGILYSITETARANNLKVYEYLKYVMEVMVRHQDDPSEEYLADLLPWSPALPEKCRMKLNK